MRPARRTVLTAGTLGAAVSLAECGGTGSTGHVVRSARRPPRFRTPLPVLAPMRPVSTGGSTDVFEVEQRATHAELLPGVRTPVMTYGGTFPGPLIQTRSGRPAVVRHTNRLDVPTTTHLHGGHTPADSDGYPTDLVRPGETREYHYPMDQRAATLWYHDHRLDHTGAQVYQGLLGIHVVHDDEDDALPLPRGAREVPLVVVDRSFDADGRLAYPAHRHGAMTGMVDDDHVEGVLGDVMLVNGAAWPELEVDAARYRFRVLNGCNARRLDLRLDPEPREGPSFTQIGSDSGLLERPVPHQHLEIAQAERFDVLVDFSSYPVGTRVELRNEAGSDGADQVMRFHVVRRARDESARLDRLPRQLSRIEPLDTSGAVRRRWSFSRGSVDGHPGWVVNGEPFDPDRDRARVPLGQVEVWRFDGDVNHPVHVHLDPFQVLARNETSGPGEFDHGWKDTVSLRPGDTVDIAVRFTAYEGRYLIHCHNLEHEDRMMMAAFRTV